MPYDIAKGFDGCPYAVVKLTPDGRELAPGGCHQTAIEAGKHLAALEAATDYERAELRHPGHGDQAVHNPNKQVSFASKMMAPEKLAAERARTKEEMDRLADGATPADRAEAMDEYDAASASAAKFEQHSTATSGLFKSESDIGGAAGEAAIKTSKTLAKEYLTIKNRINRKASTAKREGNYARSKAFRIAADGAGRLEFASGLSGFLSSVRGMAIVLEVELRAEGYAPNNAMKAEARRGLEWRAEFNRGGTEIGVARARDIMNGRNLSLDTVRRMVSYFARHEVDKQGEGWSPGEPGYPSAGRIAWALWGGNPGRSWANAISESEDKDRAVESEQELRHPGHGDQSTHNPHKGGGYVIGSKDVATPEQAAARIKENTALFASRGGTIKTGDQITKKDAAAQRLELEAEAAGVFGPSTLEVQGVAVDAAITKNNEIIKMPDGPAKDAARAEYDLLSQRQEGIGHTARTLAFRKDEGKGGQDVESVNSFYLTDTSGKVVAGGTLNHYKFGPGLTGDTELFYLGSTGKIPGAGSAIMGQVILSAAARKSPRIVIRAEADARPFYRAMGFKGDMVMTMDASAIQQIAEAIK